MIANLDAAKEAVGVWMLLSHVTSSSSSDTKLQDVENVRSDPPLQNAAAKNEMDERLIFSTNTI